MGKKKKYPSAPTYKRVKGHNKNGSAKMHNWDPKKLKGKSKKK